MTTSQNQEGTHGIVSVVSAISTLFLIEPIQEGLNGEGGVALTVDGYILGHLTVDGWFFGMTFITWN